MTLPQRAVPRRHGRRTALLLALLTGLAAAGGAVAQAGAAAAAAPAASDPMVGLPAVQSGTPGFRVMSGGAGREERQAMDARRAEFPLKVVLSAGRGDFVTAETLRLVNAQGEVLVVRDAGPVVLIQAPAGAYTLVVTYQGRTERRAVKQVTRPQTVTLRFPG